jgi:transcription elongation factor Elf1
MTGATLVAPPEPLAPAGRPDLRRTYTCPECGHVLRVVGLGRHRVYFELTDERADDPVMNRVCPACGHSLPGKNAPGSQP